MKFFRGLIFIAMILAACGFARAEVCAICGKEMTGQVYVMTDEVTSKKELVCPDCVKLPLCIICGLPVKNGGVTLPDGRALCARDAKTVVLKSNEAEKICAQVQIDLNHLFSRFTEFPDNVDVTAIDRIDVDQLFHRSGNDFESPDLLGCIRADESGGKRRYKMSLMTGLPLAELKETCAHEYSHAWVGENVNRAERGLGRDAEEGFCEMVGYLYMDSKQETLEKKRILANRYTRGQVELFIEAEQHYGFDQILDWMKYGVAAQLEAGHLDAIRDVKMLAAKTVVVSSKIFQKSGSVHLPASTSAPAALKLQGIIWGAAPMAIINGHSFGVNDSGRVKVGENNFALHCLAIRTNSVSLQNQDSGEKLELELDD